MGRLLRDEEKLFEKLGRQGVDLSMGRANLYDGGTKKGIEFREMSEEEYEAVKREILG